MNDSPRVEPLSEARPPRSGYAVLAFILAVVPPVSAFLSMSVDRLIHGEWGLVNPLTSLIYSSMMLCVPASLLLGVMAVVQILRGWYRGLGLALAALLASGGVLYGVYRFLEGFGGHY